MSLSWIIAGGFLAVAGLLFWLRRRTQPQAAGTPFRIDYDETSISVTDNFGERHVVQWHDLEKVAIRTADDGPVGSDVFWGLQTQSDHVLVFPEGAAGERELVDEMTRRLSGFNNDEVMRAMGSTSNNGLFVVWQKGEPTPPAADAGDG